MINQVIFFSPDKQLFSLIESFLMIENITTVSGNKAMLDDAKKYEGYLVLFHMKYFLHKNLKILRKFDFFSEDRKLDLDIYLGVITENKSSYELAGISKNISDKLLDCLSNFSAISTRFNERYNVELNARLLGSDKTYEKCLVTNISLGGIFILSDEIDFTDGCEVTFELSSEKFDITLCGKGVVKWHSHNEVKKQVGLGIEFVEVDLANESKLESFIAELIDRKLLS